MTVHYQGGTRYRRYTDVAQLYLTGSGDHTLRFYNGRYFTVPTGWDAYWVRPDRHCPQEGVCQTV